MCEESPPFPGRVRIPAFPLAISPPAARGADRDAPTVVRHPPAMATSLGPGCTSREPADLADAKVPSSRVGGWPTLHNCSTRWEAAASRVGFATMSLIHGSARSSRMNQDTRPSRRFRDSGAPGNRDNSHAAIPRSKCTEATGERMAFCVTHTSVLDGGGGGSPGAPLRRQSAMRPVVSIQPGSSGRYGFPPHAPTGVSHKARGGKRGAFGPWVIGRPTYPSQAQSLLSRVHAPPHLRRGKWACHGQLQPMAEKIGDKGMPPERMT